MIISHKGHSWKARRIKSADLSTGYKVYLFEPGVDSPYTNKYIVAVKSPHDSTSEWLIFERFNRAIVYYLDMLTCYA